MKQGKLIISKSNNITCIAGHTWTGKTTHLIEELKSKIYVNGKVEQFILISPELNEEIMLEFISKPEHKLKGFYINSANTEQSMLQIFDDAIELMRNTGIKTMAFDNVPKHSSMDIVNLYNKLKDIDDLNIIFSHQLVIDCFNKERTFTLL